MEKINAFIPRDNHLHPQRVSEWERREISGTTPSSRIFTNNLIQARKRQHIIKEFFAKSIFLRGGRHFFAVRSLPLFSISSAKIFYDGKQQSYL